MNSFFQIWIEMKLWILLFQTALGVVTPGFLQGLEINWKSGANPHGRVSSQKIKARKQCNTLRSRIPGPKSWYDSQRSIDIFSLSWSGQCWSVIFEMQVSGKNLVLMVLAFWIYLVLVRFRPTRSTPSHFFGTYRVLDFSSCSGTERFWSANSWLQWSFCALDRKIHFRFTIKKISRSMFMSEWLKIGCFNIR